MPETKASFNLLHIGVGCGAAALLGCLIGGSAAGWFVYASIQEAAQQQAKAEEKERQDQKRRDEQLASVRNLQQIAGAMLNYEATFARLPLAGAPAPGQFDGPPLLSWRVHLLPFVEQDPLARQIRLDERWDSPHNRRFWNQMPSIYNLPGKPNNGKTYYQVFRGKDSAFPDKGRVRLTDIHDGTSNTISVVEAATSVNWMQPADIPFELNQPKLLDRVGNHWGDDTFAAAFCDGTARSLRRTLQPHTLQALITRSGGEVAAVD